MEGKKNNMQIWRCFFCLFVFFPFILIGLESCFSFLLRILCVFNLFVYCINMGHNSVEVFGVIRIDKNAGNDQVQVLVIGNVGSMCLICQKNRRKFCLICHSRRG